KGSVFVERTLKIAYPKLLFNLLTFRTRMVPNFREVWAQLVHVNLILAKTIQIKEVLLLRAFGAHPFMG
ncbi:hypothetical protein, partial [Parasediminibacterium sp. JCM 36343]|uniref:hypothetical protein n=1 Tax=Parasediminibacterium sp. JCM 36343 TaxID=3374279 RepID=UPI00397E7DA5